ncbi:formylmethanofuran dehydrogenase subunit B [Maioricimonas rarisocia]|uniref:formylmethanofuran dehydrogenase subunit B n=1 Tax=Maioricimonas rarisocia TaxID=2528026 RepID=UPI001E63A14A|nr:formylmethanofuran dehydrogenase subunit B [Maioricimonas rarisocia]
MRDVACTVCGCVCDDLIVTTAAGRIVRAEGACALAEPWFHAQGDQQPSVCCLNGEAANVDSAVGTAAAILSDASNPLIYGLSRSSTSGQRAAVALGDRLGAIVDTTASRCHAPSIMALQQVGESTCSLGEVRQRSDVVVYWGANPLRSHPRHLERYAGEPKGTCVPRGREDRHIVVVDPNVTETAAIADTHLQVAPGRDFELLWDLRARLAGLPADASATHGVPAETVDAFAERIRNARYGIVFFGLGLTRQQNGHRDVEALLQMVRDAHRHTRWSARRMRIPGDVAGADSVLCWQTGFPFSVDFSRGYPRYNPGEFSANELLERGDVDACLLLGCDGIGQFSDAAMARLETIPTIVFDDATVETSWVPDVRFTTAAYGIHLPGTAYRMDEVPIPLRPVLETEYPSDEEILQQIDARLTVRR